MVAPTNSGDQSDMATEEHFDWTRCLNSPSPPPSFPTSSNEHFDWTRYFNSPSPPLYFPPSSNFDRTRHFNSPSPPLYFPPSSNEHFDWTRHFNPPSPPPSFPPSSNSMVVNYQGSGQSPMDNQRRIQQRHDEDMVDPLLYLARDSELLQQPSTPAPPISWTRPYAGISQRPTNSGESNMATEDFNVSILLDFLSSQNVVYLDYEVGVDWPPFIDRRPHIARPPYIAGDLALWLQMLLQFWIDGESDNWGPRGGIMTINKQNLPQSLEALGFSLLDLYVGDEFYKLYWQGESWNQLKMFMSFASLLFPGAEFTWMYTWHDSELKNYGQGLFVTDRVSMGVWRIGPREWVAKIRYRQHSLPKSFCINYQGRVCVSREVDNRNRQVVFENARLHFPDLVQVFHHADTAAQRKNPDEDSINGEGDQEGIQQMNPDTLRASGVTFDTNNLVLLFYSPLQFSPTARQVNPDEDFVNREVKPVGIGGERTEEAEIAEPNLNPVPSGKRKRKEKTPRGNKKTTPVRNVITLEKILQVKEMPRKACQEHGISSWPPHNKHEGITQSLPNKTPAIVDQEGIPRLTSDTPSSYQALTATFDTNSVVEETAPQQISPTVQQENPDENFVNGEVEPFGIGGEGTEEGEIVEAQSNSGHFVKRKRKEKTPRGDKGNKKTTRVRNEISYEEILQVQRMRLEDATRHLKVSRYALKHVCRKYGIHRWPPRNEYKTPMVVDQERIPPLTSNTVPSDQALMATVDTNNVCFKGNSTAVFADSSTREPR